MIILIHKLNKKKTNISPYMTVPKEGLEPSRPKRAMDFESIASANSATSA